MSEPGMADKPKEAVSIKGSCLCRGIQYELRGAPLANTLCYCDNCRKSLRLRLRSRAVDTPKTNSASPTAKTSSGCSTTPTLIRGSVIHRAFCGTCGSPLSVTHSVYVNMVSVWLGSME